MADLNVALILRLIDQATGPARAAIANVQAAGERVQRFGEAQIAAGRAMQETAAARTAALQGQTLAAVGMGFALYGVMRPAVMFEDAMARVGAVSGATAEEQARLTATARELGAATVFSASQAAEGMQYLAMAGFDVNQTIAAMPGLLNLAAAAGADLGRTSDIASNILSGFGFQAGEMGRVGDVLVNTFTSSNTTLEMLGATMSYVAPQAAAAGMQLETVAAMAGILGNNGVQGERGGTALRAMLTRLASPSEEAAAALERLNVQVSDEGGNLRDIPTILAEMDQAMEGMGSAVRQELLTAIFGMEASTSALILASAAGSGELQRYAETLRETGSAARVAEQMNDTARGSLRRLASAAEEAQIALGNGLLPVLAEIVERVLPVVVTAGQWIEANQGLVTSIGYVAAVLIGLNVATLAARWGFWLLFGWVGRVRVALGALMMASGMLAQVLATGLAWSLWALTAAATRALGGFRLLLSGLLALKAAATVGWVAAKATALAGLTAASGAASAAVAALGRTLATAGRFLIAHPLVAAVVAIAGAAALIYANWDRIGPFFTELWATVAEAARAAWAAVAQWAAGLVGEVATAVSSGAAALYDAGAAMIQSLWDGAVARFWQFLDWIRSIPSQVVAAIGSIDLSGVLRWPGSGGAPSPGAARMAPGSASYPSQGINPVPRSGGRAIGGPVRPGFGYEVGEEGAEFFIPDQPGRIVRHQDVARLMAQPAAAPAPQITLGDIVIHAAPGMDPAAIGAEVRRQIEERLRQARFALNDGGLYA